MAHQRRACERLKGRWHELDTGHYPMLTEPAALARLIARASTECQIIVVSHAAPLVSALQDAGAKQIVLEKKLGETVVPGEERPAWNWPSR